MKTDCGRVCRACHCRAVDVLAFLRSYTGTKSFRVVVCMLMLSVFLWIASTTSNQYYQDASVIDRCQCVGIDCSAVTNQWPAPRCLHFDAEKQNWKTNSTILNARYVETSRQILHHCGNCCKHMSLQSSRPEMAPDEYAFIAKAMIAARPRHYLEYGTGTSTPLFASLAVHTTTVDHVESWCAKVAAFPTVKCLKASNRLTSVCVDAHDANNASIPLIEYGRPLRTEDNLDLGLQYVNAIDRAPHPKLFDFVLVDGRFRAATCLKILSRMTRKGVVVIHDFWFRTQPYSVVFEYYNVIGRANTLIMLQPKRNHHGFERFDKDLQRHISDSM
jgi:predicted O-methyltransferase YrrM